jgi:hypothetical protein
MCSWDKANRGQELGLVWIKRKKISQIINDYLYLPFFLLIILCYASLLIVCRAANLRLTVRDSRLPETIC